MKYKLMFVFCLRAAFMVGCIVTCYIQAHATGSITGDTTVCVGSTITLSDSISGGRWHSSNMGRATVDSMTGVVTGVGAGIVTITYAIDTSYSVRTITIDTIPFAGMISGLSSLCPGGTPIALSDTAAGGTWSASNGNATVSGGIVMGIMSGDDTINYSVTNACGTAIASMVITVLPLPDPGIITTADSFTVCMGGTLTLSETVAGGTWSEQNGSTSVTSGGVVTGNFPGVDSVLYTVTNGCGSSVAEVEVTIIPPLAALVILGATQFCTLPSTMAFSPYTSTIPGGTWATSNPLVVDVIFGFAGALTPGTATISYTVSNVCGTATATQDVTVYPTPRAGVITGPKSVCKGATITLTDTAMGGTGIWSSQDGNTIVSGSTVKGRVVGTDSVHYQVSNYCGTRDIAVQITVNAVPAPVITDSGDTLGTTLPYTSYKWMKSGSATVLGTNAMYIATDTGSYIVEVSNAESCTGTSVIYIYMGDGVADIRTKASSVKIYPNPAQSVLYIQSPVRVNARLTTIDGREILDMKDAQQMDMSSLPKGVYFITVFDGNTGSVIMNDKIVKVE